MVIQANKAAARGYFERLLNAGEFHAADAIFSSDARFHYPIGKLEGIVQIRNYITAVRTAIPDIEFVIEDLLGEKELVAVRWTLTGTQTGEFRGNPPTGKRVEVPGNTIFRMSDGRIREMWVAFEPQQVVACHCTECQKQSCSAFGMSMVVSEDAFRISKGEPKIYRSTSPTGRAKVGAFCPDCGTRVYHQPDWRKGAISVKPGTLDDTSWLRPDLHIWTSNRQPWVTIPESVQSHPGRPS